MALYRTVLPHRMPRPYQHSQKHSARIRADRHQELLRAFFLTWWNARQDRPLSRDRYNRALRSDQLREIGSAIWVSKRALHEDCVNFSDAAIPWHMFLTLLREVHPAPTRSF